MSALTVAPVRQQSPAAELVRVTPELAEKWLGKNTRNRNLRSTKVRTYAGDIAAGDWLVTGDGPKFDHTGRLINGQHFLSAVIASGQTVDTFVFYGLHPDAQLVMDTGAKRSSADALKFRGVEGCNLNVLAAASRIAILWEEGAYRRSGQSSYAREVTHTETLTWVEENTDAIDATAAADNLRRSLPIPPSVLAFAYLMTSRLDADDASRFFADAANMRTTGKGDPVYTMLRRYRSAEDRNESLAPPQHLFLIFRSWNAYRAGEPLFQLKVGTAGAQGAIGMVEPA